MCAVRGSASVLTAARPNKSILTAETYASDSTTCYRTKRFLINLLGQINMGSNLNRVNK